MRFEAEIGLVGAFREFLHQIKIPRNKRRLVQARLLHWSACVWAELGASCTGQGTAPVATNEIQDVCGPHLAGLGCNTYQQELRVWPGTIA